MPSVLFFQNIRNPRYANGTPFFPHDRGVAFCNTDYHFASPLDVLQSPFHVHHPGASSNTLKDWVKNTFGDLQPNESDYQPGTAYKRIYRPPVFGSFYRAIDVEKRTQNFVALKILINKLEVIFQTIEPKEENRNTYGHLVRELLLLACMEVESCWAAVLKENGYNKNRLVTSDYFKLKNPMHLDSYTLSLASYPHFQGFSPFDGWDSSRATQSLPWYDAYNKTKHNREQNLNCATLANTIHAVGAAVVMFCAQFGFEVEPRVGEQPILSIRNTFSLTTDFNNHKQDCYIPEFTVPSNSSPTPSLDWRLVNYPF